MRERSHSLCFCSLVVKEKIKISFYSPPLSFTKGGEVRGGVIHKNTCSIIISSLIKYAIIKTVVQ